MTYCIEFEGLRLYSFKWRDNIVHMWGPFIPDYYGLSQRVGSLSLFSIPEQAQRLMDSCPQFYRGAQILPFEPVQGETDNGAHNSKVNV